MILSVFTDELKIDIKEGLPVFKSWGLAYCDLRSRILGKPVEALTDEDLAALKKLLGDHDMTVAVLQSSLAKVHLPDKERQAAERKKLEGIIRAADALDCRLVRAFHYWQPRDETRGRLAELPDEMAKVQDLFAPLAKRAQEAGLTLAFENCGVLEREAIAFLDTLGIPEWGLGWDCCNFWDNPARERDEAAYIRAHASRSTLIHVKAKSAVPELGGTVLPWARILSILQAEGFAGPVSIETHNPKGSPISDEEATRRTLDAVRAAWPAPLAEPAKAEPRAVHRSYEDRPVGFGVVGLGLGHNRALKIQETPGCALAIVCDLNEERAKRTGAACGVPATTNLDDLLDNDAVEVVFVGTPTGRHAEIALRALDAGKHVLTTKPMEASVAACDEMILKAEEKGLLLAVDFSRRFEPGTVTLKHAIEAGAFGQLLGCESSVKILRTQAYYAANGGWRGTRRWDGGGVLSNQCIHMIDKLAFCLGIPAQVRCHVWTQHHAVEAEDLGCAVWQYENGLILNLFATTNYPFKTWLARVELHGTQGAYRESKGGPDRPFTQWFINGAWQDEPPRRIRSEWLNGMDNMAAAVRTGAPLVCDGRDGRRSQAILEAMYRSAYGDGGWVAVQSELAQTPAAAATLA
ncbi:MAG: Gfo/Idh/MocA family oxidoreductase [Kiritimatiellae bacterium]|nr:Gfo/Idh/MocA family oxidoreductase [Kiritimatiellia bacterium]